LSTEILLFASGDLRETANRTCWPAQAEMEARLTDAIRAEGHTVRRAHPIKSDRGHGFLASQREGMDAFADIDPTSPVIVAEAVWQYSHHVLPGLMHHKGPILTVANWSGQWPGLVGVLNLNASLTKAGVKYSTLWSEQFDDAFFLDGIRAWIRNGEVRHDESHVARYDVASAEPAARTMARDMAADLRRRKVILGVFDEGCMGMYNAIVPDELMAPMGFFKERLSQSTLYYEALIVSDNDAGGVFDWLQEKGMRFHFGPDPERDLTRDQVLLQCKTYIAAARIAQDFGCDAIGIQYQQGLKDLLPASDLAEGLLNNIDRPAAPDRSGRPIRPRQAIVHFNEADECAGIDGVLINRVHTALGQPAETTLHDLRWGDLDHSGTVDEFVWVLQISGASPPAHHDGGWSGTESYRQPPMFFRLGGGTVRGISHPGPIIWSRIFVADGRLNMDIGIGRAVALPESETRRRSDATTPQWPIMHAVLEGVSRDQMMARHKANHIQVAYAKSAEDAVAAAHVRACLAVELGMTVHWCGTQRSLNKE
jgi:hypothetical protein